MRHLHDELRKAREKAGLSQQALAARAGIPRNQVVRAERGENITVETLRKIAAHLPLTELPLLDTQGFRIDIVPEPEKLFIAALQNVLRIADALYAAVALALETHAAAETARRATPPEEQQRSADFDPDPVLLLRGFERIAGEIKDIAQGREARVASN